MKKIAALFLIIVGVAGSALAATSAPEIDPASGVGALTLLAGAVLVIRGRRK